MGFCYHFSELQCMKDFGVVEELYQWSRLTQDARLKREAVFRAAFQEILGGLVH
jgi:hypothetical protein